MLPKSTQKLVAALKSSGRLDLGAIIQRAESNYYHEFISDIAFPITTLVRDLHLIGCEDLAVRAKNGEFDATKEEADEWMDKNIAEFFS